MPSVPPLLWICTCMQYAVRAAQYGVGMFKVMVMVIYATACIDCNGCPSQKQPTTGSRQGPRQARRRRAPPDLADPVG